MIFLIGTKYPSGYCVFSWVLKMVHTGCFFILGKNNSFWINMGQIPLCELQQICRPKMLDHFYFSQLDETAISDS